jgi:nucleotide-binding universal stress UspA family protein
MPIKEILLHLDNGPAAPARIDLAAGLARRLDAHLVGLFVTDVAFPMFAGDIGSGAAMAEMITQMLDAAHEEGRKLEAVFREKLARQGIAGAWRQIEGLTAQQVALQGRYTDLVMVGQPSPDGPETSGAAMIEAALFGTGRPVLVAPYAGKFTTVGTRALVAWNASPEASRALPRPAPRRMARNPAPISRICWRAMG